MDLHNFIEMNDPSNEEFINLLRNDESEKEVLKYLTLIIIKENLKS